MVAMAKAGGRVVKFTYALPETIKGVRYVTNHHFVELEYKDERKVKLLASGLMRFECKRCAFHWLAPTNRGHFCPNCGHEKIEKKWGRLQLAFIPEEEIFPPQELDPTVEKAPVPPELVEEDSSPTLCILPDQDESDIEGTRIATKEDLEE